MPESKVFGVCLLQEEKPVYFASKTLKDAQKGYMATELKLLVEVWAMEKFHHFFICQWFHLRNWPEIAWSYIIKEFESSNSKITANTDQNFCLPLYSKIYSWYQPTSLQIVCCMTRLSKRYHQAIQAAYTSDYKSIECKKRQLEWYKNCSPRQWWAWTTQAHYSSWMAWYHQRSTKWNPTILDLQRRADSGRWYYLERHSHSGLPTRNIKLLYNSYVKDI